MNNDVLADCYSCDITQAKKQDIVSNSRTLYFIISTNRTC